MQFSMEIIKTVAGLQSVHEKIPTGLVPTMGALHQGHISLIRKAITECPLVIVTIYVNPTQFNDKEDLRRYPRNVEADLKLLEKELRETDIVFIPDDKEIYPFEDKRKFSFGNLDKVMEAVHRPGHFNGVAQVVSRLFEITKPQIAYFGLKDFQQLAVIRNLTEQLRLNIRITGCPIVREDDGLAMSSRNMLLGAQLRKKAPVIYAIIKEASEMFGEKEPPEIISYVEKKINSDPDFRIEYFEIVDEKELLPLTKNSEIDNTKAYFGCIAVKAGNIRLIDNIQMGCYHQKG